MSHNIDARRPRLDVPEIDAVLSASLKAVVAEPARTRTLFFKIGRIRIALQRPSLGSLGWALGFAALTTALIYVSAYYDIAPEVESDYCYQLLAVRRFDEGHGLTSLQPFAPGQPWDHRYDWGFLTQWPFGYSVLILLLEHLSGSTALGAAGLLGAVGCSATMLGWLNVALRLLPDYRIAVPLGLVAGAVGLSPGSLVNPQSDVLLTGAIPWLALVALRSRNRGTEARQARGGRTWRRLFLLGFATGLLSWLRYAALFVGPAMAAFIVAQPPQVGDRPHAAIIFRARLGPAFIFLLGWMLPIATILGLNAAAAQSGSVQGQLNLGSSMRLSFDSALIVESWKTLTRWGFYAHRPEAPWFWHLGTLALLLAALASAIRSRGNVERRFGSAWVLCGLLVGFLWLEIVAASTFFGQKFNYASLERYYLPARPALVLFLFTPLWIVSGGARLMAAPLSLVGLNLGLDLARRLSATTLRGGLAMGLALALHWQVAFDWSPTLMRWSRLRTDRTPFGAWAQVFSPGADRLYAWIERSIEQDAVIFSNFHDFLALETGRVTYPLPRDDAHLMETLRRLSPPDSRKSQRLSSVVRGTLPSPRVYFILDHSNRWRDYYWPDTKELVQRLRLKVLPRSDLKEDVDHRCGWCVYYWSPPSDGNPIFSNVEP